MSAYFETKIDAIKFTTDKMSVNMDRLETLRPMVTSNSQRI